MAKADFLYMRYSRSTRRYTNVFPDAAGAVEYIRADYARQQTALIALFTAIGGVIFGLSAGAFLSYFLI